MNDDPQYEMFDVTEEQKPFSIKFMPSGTSETPILSIDETGFYVRGERVPVDEKESATVYKAFKQFLVEAELRRP